MILEVKEITNEDKLIQEIKSLLKEELSIASQVVAVTNDLLNKIVSGKRDFQYSFFNLGEFHVVCQNEILSNWDDEAFGSTKFSTKTLALQIPIFYQINRNGEVKPRINKKTLKKLIQHEVEHIFQVSEKNGNTDTKYDKIYDVAVTIMNGYGNPVDWNRNMMIARGNLANFVYKCAPTEQDAMVNELYSTLVYNNKAQSRKKELTIYDKSNVAEAIRQIDGLLSEITDPATVLNYIEPAKEYNRDIAFFVRLGNKAKQRLMAKAGHAIIKARQDLAEGSTFTPSKPPYNY